MAELIPLWLKHRGFPRQTTGIKRRADLSAGGPALSRFQGRQARGEDHFEGGEGSRTTAVPAWNYKGELAFPQHFRRVLQCFMNILSLKIGIGGEYLRFGHAISNHSHHRGNWDPQAANASNPVHLSWVHDYPLKSHCLSPTAILPCFGCEEQAMRSLSSPDNRGECKGFMFNATLTALEVASRHLVPRLAP